MIGWSAGLPLRQPPIAAIASAAPNTRFLMAPTITDSRAAKAIDPRTEAGDVLVQGHAAGRRPHVARHRERATAVPDRADGRRWSVRGRHDGPSDGDRVRRTGRC